MFFAFAFAFAIFVCSFPFGTEVNHVILFQWGVTLTI